MRASAADGGAGGDDGDAAVTGRRVTRHVAGVDDRASATDDDRCL